LYGIAHNVLREHFRAQAQGRVVDFAAVSVADLGMSIGSQVAASQQQLLLLFALRTLPLQSQELLELFYWEEIGVSELARILDMPAGTIKRRLWRARRLLEEALGRLEMSDALRRTTTSTLASWAAAHRERRAEDTGEYADDDTESTDSTESTES
jgi:RNA polymerase sigma-70 factor (ECF subfamily)